MTNKSIKIEIDLEVNAGYVRYRDLKPGEIVARNKRVSPDVIVDFDSQSRILGIELLAFDTVSQTTARSCAEAHGLVFPEIARQSSEPAVT